MKHHAGHSGYDQLIDYIDVDRVIAPAKATPMQKVMAYFARPAVKNSGLKWYHRINLVAEVQAGRIWLKDSNQIFHYLYGENSYRYLGMLKGLKRKNNKIICTYHIPPYRFPEIVKNTGHFSQIDAAIAVSTMQLDYLSELVGSERVFYVPHGIDVDYFRPSDVVKYEAGHFKCLFVGTHLRDFETLAETASLLERLGEQIEIIAVTSPTNRALLDGHENITMLSNISDEELLRLYQESDILLLPLLGATANNSILEAVACGLPILVTDLPGVKDYVTSDIAVFVGMSDANALAEEVIRLYKDREQLKRMSVACREHALKFGWREVAKKTIEIYNQVLS